MTVEATHIRQCRSLIIGRLISIQNSADETLKDLRDRSGGHSDFFDQATLETERNINFSLRERDRKSVREMREAMKRIEEGTFGICRICQKPISPGRLQANPAATLCIACKEREEKDHLSAA